jgi:hypothetical protein
LPEIVSEPDDGDGLEIWEKSTKVPINKAAAMAPDMKVTTTVAATRRVFSHIFPIGNSD